MSQVINANLAKCIQEIHHIGSTTYVNICSGAEKTVPWGSRDWVFCLFIGGLLGGALLVVIFLFYKMIFDDF